MSSMVLFIFLLLSFLAVHIYYFWSKCRGKYLLQKTFLHGRLHYLCQKIFFVLIFFLLEFVVLYTYISFGPIPIHLWVQFPDAQMFKQMYSRTPCTQYVKIWWELCNIFKTKAIELLKMLVQVGQCHYLQWNESSENLWRGRQKLLNLNLGL